MEPVFFVLNISPLYEDAALYARAFAAVDGADRREKIDRIKVQRERCLSLGGALLLQKALRDAGAGEPVLACGEHGKPYLANLPGVHFNISHSGDHVVCALSGSPVGCDIESIKPFRENVAARCFSPEENAALAALTDPAARETLFFRFWTLKESFLKAVGCGITRPLASVSFDLSGDSPVLRQTVAPGPFFFREYASVPGYRVALCQTSDAPFPPLTEVSVEEICK